MKENLRYLLFVVILFGTPYIFISAGDSLGIHSDTGLFILCVVGFAAGYLIAKGIWGGKKE